MDGYTRCRLRLVSHPEQSSIVNLRHGIYAAPPPSFMYTTQTKIQYIYIELLTNINAYLTLLFTKNTPFPRPSTYLPTLLHHLLAFPSSPFFPPFFLSSIRPPFPSSLPFFLPFFLSFSPYLSIHSFGACCVRRSIVISDIWGI